MREDSRIASYHAKKAVKRYKKDNNYVFRPRRFMKDNEGSMDGDDLIAMAIVGFAAVSLAIAACALTDEVEVEPSDEDKVAEGDTVYLRGSVLDEAHYGGEDEKYGTDDDLYQIHMSSRSGKKAVDFNGYRWNCTEMNEKINPGYELELKAMKKSRGHYEAMEVKKIKKN
ncbi:MAG: hypothetical protein ACE5J7_00495 [Candidatus Aenigmatarchaeota archaeon]